MPTTLNSIMAETPASSEAPERENHAGRAGMPKAASGGGGEGYCVPVLSAELEDPPTRPEVAGWYVYGLCTYFVQAFLLPVLFPLMVAQRAYDVLPEPPAVTSLGAACHRNETVLYQMLVHRSISIGNSKLSPLHWTAISWFAGIIVSAPVLPKVAQHLDGHSYHQPFILGAGTAIGSAICLLTGFFKTIWPFPFYIAIITLCITSASAVHTRHLGLIVRGLAGERSQRRRTVVSSRMSLYAAAVGSLGTAVIALFTYHMLRRADHLTSLWVVSIFCGLKWFLGFTEAFFANRPGLPSANSLSPASNYWPQLTTGLVGVFLSSFSSMCIFAGATLYIVGSLCMKPVFVLAVWMAYFLFAAVALPALHPLQLLIRGDPVKMNLLGFLMSAVASGVGFYFKSHRWHWVAILFMSLVQAAGAGVLHAFGKVMILDRSPAGREGVFSAWYEWVRISGACAGFALAAASPDDIRKTFGLSFLAVFVGVVVLIFGSDLSGFGGGSTRGRHEKESEGASSENGMEKFGDQSMEYIRLGSKLDGKRKCNQEEGEWTARGVASGAPLGADCSGSLSIESKLLDRKGWMQVTPMSLPFSDLPFLPPNTLLSINEEAHETCGSIFST